MKVLITGSNGQLGQELQITMPADIKLYACDAKTLDITKADEVYSTIELCEPDVVINAAAYTALDNAEVQEKAAFAVNATGAENIATACRKHGSRLIHISTDFVFNGNSPLPYQPEEEPEPINVYGHTKLQGELKVRDTMRGEALILRTAWLYSKYSRNFVKTILRLLKEKEKLFVVFDQVGSPTWAKSFAETIWRAILYYKELKGVYHYCDAGLASRFDFAVTIQSEALRIGLLDSKIPILPVRSWHHPTPARRPANSVLDCSKTYKDMCLTPVHWQHCLSEMIKDIKTEA